MDMNPQFPDMTLYEPQMYPSDEDAVYAMGRIMPDAEPECMPEAPASAAYTPGCLMLIWDKNIDPSMFLSAAREAVEAAQMYCGRGEQMLI